jgi:hypothetical protein
MIVTVRETTANAAKMVCASSTPLPAPVISQGPNEY